MSSTRKAKDDSVFHQARYASSPEFERGLIANLVALRCSTLDTVAGRELVWFLQYLSHQAGGVPALARELIGKFPDRLQTPAMVEIGMKPGKNCNAAQVKSVRGEIPHEFASRFPLKGEADFLSVISHRPYRDDEAASDAALARAMSPAGFEIDEKSNSYPASYPARTFIDLCRAAAESELENYLRELCVNPAIRLASGPWYFPGLIETLREYKSDFIKSKIADVYTTALGQKVFEVLDYTAYCRGLTLIQGEARLGKSHAGRAWCEQHPGTARFVEVPSGNDEVTFFRDLARGLGLGNFLNYKVVQIRERVEYVLRTGDIILVLDEAQRLWPQTNFREGYPKRIAWVMTMANAGVPICMISTPQFFVTQKVVEKNGWNSAQLTGRISHYEPLPLDLSQEDLIGVAKSVLPEASANVLRALAVYARSSARYLAAIDSIAKRSHYIAQLAGRAEATANDVRRAMQESVIPADTKLHRALESVGKGKLAKILPAPVMPITSTETWPAPEPPAEEILPAHSRLAPIAIGSRHRAGNPTSLIEA